jgi:hypothetical protein
VPQQVPVTPTPPTPVPMGPIPGTSGQVPDARPATPVEPATKPMANTSSQTKMTPAQAEELFRSVDTILAFASKDSQLPIQHTVKRKLISRTEVNTMLRKKFDEDKGAKRMEREELVLKKFGLLDRDFHLQPFMLSLLTEQIAGFYDDETKTVNLLDWIAPDEQKPVLAHELTHALQDQKVNLIKWSDASLVDLSKNAEEDNKHIATDEASTARDAVAEGQAMAVFVDWGLRDTGKTIADAPDMAGRVGELTADTSDSPILARAPLLLQESLLFPYSDGLAFEQAMLAKKGPATAFAGVLANPPSSTYQIIHPEAYIEKLPVPLLHLPNIHPLIDAAYAPYDVGVMGELDVRIITELFGGREIATALSPAWNGGIYYAAQRKAATPAEKQTTAAVAILYDARWRNHDSALSFLHVYQEQLPRKYTTLKERKADEASDDEQVYTTEEGDVVLTIADDSVFITEGFPLALARQLRDMTLAAQGTGAVQSASLGNGAGSGMAAGSQTGAWMQVGANQPLHDPALSLAAWMSGFGMPRAALSLNGRYTQTR